MLLVEQVNSVQSQIYGGTNLQNDGSFAASSVGRITANYVNGPATTVNGVDFTLNLKMITLTE